LASRTKEIIEHYTKPSSQREQIAREIYG